MDITQEKALEYQQVAALACLDIDLLSDICEQEDMTLERLKAQIRLVKGNKDDMISDPRSRNKRYTAATLVFGAVAEGLVWSESLEYEEPKP